MEGCIDGSLAIDWIWWIERLEELDRELYNIHLVEKYMMNSCCCVSFFMCFNYFCVWVYIYLLICLCGLIVVCRLSGYD